MKVDQERKREEWGGGGEEEGEEEEEGVFQWLGMEGDGSLSVRAGGEERENRRERE